MKRVVPIIASVMFVLGATSAFAADAPKNEKKQTTLGLYLTAAEAFEAKSRNANVLFIDVRTRGEVAFLGMPTVADANVPYMELTDIADWDEKKASFKLEPNSAFLERVERLVKAKGLTKASNIIIMCRSGERSANAANLLAKAGYTSVYSVVDGYEGDMAKDGPNAGRRAVNGWKNAGLPWSYHLERDKMYFN